MRFGSTASTGLRWQVIFGSSANASDGTSSHIPLPAGITDLDHPRLCNVGPSELRQKGEKEVSSATGYLERKRDSIPCYTARRHLDLRNSPDAAERANNALVSRRQQKEGLSWSDNGSFALGMLTASFVGVLSEGLRGNGTWSLKMMWGSAESLSKVGVNRIVGLGANLTVTPGKGWVVPSRGVASR